MNIELIENGMELSKVREILNDVIQKINQGEETRYNYKDLDDRPCINGVTLTAETTASELNLTLSQLGNVSEVENLVTRVIDRTATEAAKNTLATKLDSDFSKLPEMKYNFNEQMLLTISDGNSIFKSTIEDMLLYFKYLILKDATFERLVSGGGENKPVTGVGIGEQGVPETPENPKEQELK
jgi:hypothetical protein